MDTRWILVIVSVVAFFAGILIFLSLPRDLELGKTEFYMYGKNDLLAILSIVMMFGGAFGIVAGFVHIKKDAISGSTLNKVTTNNSTIKTSGF